jgi:hypothetical protein
VPPEILVLSNHTSSARVYVQNVRGKTHPLGQVQHSDLKVLVVPGEIAAEDGFRIKTFPAAPQWAPTGYGEGIRTGDLILKEYDTRIPGWSQT